MFTAAITVALIVGCALVVKGSHTGEVGAAPPRIASATIRPEDRTVTVVWDDAAATASDFNAVWLRDVCRCSQCIHTNLQSRQLFVLDFIDRASIAPASVDVVDDGAAVRIQWPCPAAAVGDLVDDHDGEAGDDGGMASDHQASGPDHTCGGDGGGDHGHETVLTTGFLWARRLSRQAQAERTALVRDAAEVLWSTTDSGAIGAGSGDGSMLDGTAVMPVASRHDFAAVMADDQGSVFDD